MSAGRSPARISCSAESVMAIASPTRARSTSCGFAQLAVKASTTGGTSRGSNGDALTSSRYRLPALANCTRMGVFMGSTLMELLKWRNARQTSKFGLASLIHRKRNVKKGSLGCPFFVSARSAGGLHLFDLCDAQDDNLPAQRATHHLRSILALLFNSCTSLATCSCCAR